MDSAKSLFGRLDILVNNAGTNIRKSPQSLTLSEWTTVLDTNLTSAFVCSQAAYPHMCDAGGGKVINIGSMYSLFGAPMVVAYSASKGGIVQMTKSMAAAWAPDNIQVNAVLPGWIDTDLTRQARNDLPELNDKVLTRTPAGRWGEPTITRALLCSWQARRRTSSRARRSPSTAHLPSAVRVVRLRPWQCRAMFRNPRARVSYTLVCGHAPSVVYHRRQAAEAGRN